MTSHLTAFSSNLSKQQSYLKFSDNFKIKVHRNDYTIYNISAYSTYNCFLKKIMNMKCFYVESILLVDMCLSHSCKINRIAARDSQTPANSIDRRLQSLSAWALCSERMTTSALCILHINWVKPCMLKHDFQTCFFVYFWRLCVSGAAVVWNAN